LKGESENANSNFQLFL